jgi:phospholipid/cholesterol/gamma-HCH transport system substrate-binding protein
MKRLSIEAKVGFFVVIAILMLAYMSMKVGVFRYGIDQGYPVHAYFDSAEGLVIGVPVEIAGVEVGQVKEITLEEGRAKVTLLLEPDLQVSQEARAALRTRGVLGDRYVEIIPGPPGTPPLKPEGRIERTVSPANLDSLLGQLTTIAEDVKNITGPISNVLREKEGEEAPLQTIVDNFVELARVLNETMQENQQNINRILDNFSVFSSDLREIAGSNKASLKETMDALREISQNLDETIAAVRQITKKVERGEGTIGRLIHEDETVDNLNATLTSFNDLLEERNRFRTYVDYRGEYLFDSQDMKSYLSLRIQPKEDKYYMLQVVDDPAGEKRVTEVTRTIDGVTTHERKEKVDKDELKFSAQIAKRYYDLGLRAGIFESKGGFATDYYLLDDDLVLSLEAFDFDEEDNPHLKFRADYTPFQYLYMTLGFDDFVSDDGNESFFLGGGLHFSDEDLKTLLQGAPITR